MDNTFDDSERLYRAVYPPSHPGMFWKKDGRISPSAFADPRGLSVERGIYRKSEEIVEKMKKTFPNLRYIDKIIYEWTKKSNMKEREEYKELFDYDWLGANDE